MLCSWWAEVGSGGYGLRMTPLLIWRMNVIEGLKVIVKGSELVDLCNSRAEFHIQRAVLYRNQALAMDENRLEGMHNTSAGDPATQLKEKAKGHEADHDEMKFIAKHVVLQEQYLLGREDLAKLGITKSRY